MKTAQTLAIVAMISIPLGTAWNMTIEELSDKYDDSLTTKFQPELIIQSWGACIQALVIAGVASFKQNKQ